jgi:hypothetical protein
MPDVAVIGADRVPPEDFVAILKQAGASRVVQTEAAKFLASRPATETRADLDESDSHVWFYKLLT